MAGFEVIMNGRFWASAEATKGNRRRAYDNVRAKQRALPKSRVQRTS